MVSVICLLVINADQGSKYVDQTLRMIPKAKALKLTLSPQGLLNAIKLRVPA